MEDSLINLEDRNLFRREVMDNYSSYSFNNSFRYI